MGFQVFKEDCLMFILTWFIFMYLLVFMYPLGEKEALWFYFFQTKMVFSQNYTFPKAFFSGSHTRIQNFGSYSYPWVINIYINYILNLIIVIKKFSIIKKNQHELAIFVSVPFIKLLQIKLKYLKSQAYLKSKHTSFASVIMFYS